MTSRRLLAALAAALAAAGCFRGKLPPLDLYRLAPPPAEGEAPTPTADGPAPRVGIAVAPYDTPGVYGSARIVYRVAGRGYGAYPTREWAVPLADELGALTERVIRERGLTGGDVLFDPPRRRQYPLEWRGRVRELEEVVRNDSVLVAVALEAQLIRTADDSVVWMSRHRIERPAQGEAMSQIVAALSATAADVIARLADDARSAVAAAAAVPPEPTAGRAP